MSEMTAPQPAVELPIEELTAIIAQAEVRALSARESAKLKVLVETFALLKEELQSKKTSIERLKRMLFGARTEKTSAVLGEQSTGDEAAAGDKAGDKPDSSDGGKQRKGHGRNGAAAYVGAEKVSIPHPSLHRGDVCPHCAIGKVYPMQEPGVRVRFRGVAPLQAKVYECARLRCGACGEVYSAAAPDGVGDEKYDETVPAVVGLLRYGVGLCLFHTSLERSAVVLSAA